MVLQFARLSSRAQASLSIQRMCTASCSLLYYFCTVHCIDSNLPGQLRLFTMASESSKTDSSVAVE